MNGVRGQTLGGESVSVIHGSIKRLFVAVGVWLLPMFPAIVLAGHHPGHGASEGGATVWILLGLIAFVGIMVLVGRKRK